MDRSEFLQQLRLALQGSLDQAKVNEHLQYYETYIIEESRKGRMEAEVIEELGSPRLIAKTLIDTAPAEYSEAGAENYRSAADSFAGTQGPNSEEGYSGKGFHIGYDKNGNLDVRYGRFKLNSWYGYTILFVIMLLFLILVARILISLIPILVPLFIIGFLFLLIRGRR